MSGDGMTDADPLIVGQLKVAERYYNDLGDLTRGSVMYGAWREIERLQNEAFAVHAEVAYLSGLDAQSPFPNCPVCGLRSCHADRVLTPTRESVCPLAVQHVRTFHKEIWGEAYKPGHGPLHYAGGPYWNRQLLKLADKWERMAKSARIVAKALPNE